MVRGGFLNTHTKWVFLAIFYFFTSSLMHAGGFGSELTKRITPLEKGASLESMQSAISFVTNTKKFPSGFYISGSAWKWNKKLFNPTYDAFRCLTKSLSKSTITSFLKKDVNTLVKRFEPNCSEKKRSRQRKEQEFYFDALAWKNKMYKAAGVKPKLTPFIKSGGGNGENPGNNHFSDLDAIGKFLNEKRKEIDDTEFDLVQTKNDLAEKIESLTLQLMTIVKKLKQLEKAKEDLKKQEEQVTRQQETVNSFVPEK